MKIKQYQWGGVYGAPPQYSSPSNGYRYPSSTSNTSQKTPFKDAIMKLMEKSGLPNDYRYATNTIGEMMIQMESLGGDYDPSMYTSVLQLVNEMSYHKDQYDNAVTAMSTIDAGEDIAMSGGRMYVVDAEGNISTIKPTDFNPEKYQVLTNDDLLNVRSHSDKFEFNTSMLRDVANCTNMSKISDKIVKFARELAESSATGYASSNGKMKSLVDGAEALMAEGPNGEYKFTKSEQINEKDIDAFVEYAYQNLLTDNEKNYLAADTVTSGGNPRSKSDLFNSLRTAVEFYTKHSISVDFDGTATDERAGRRAGSEKTGSDIQMELAEIYATGEGGSYTESNYFNITPEGANASMTAFGVNVGRVYQESSGRPGQALGYASFAKIMQDAYGIPKICGDAVWFGNQLVSGQELNNLVYDNSSMYTAVLPAKYENGNWKPDFDTQDKIDNMLKNISNMDPASIQIFVNQQIPGARYDATTNTIIPAQTHRFLVTSAMADPNYLETLNTNSRYIEEMGKDEASLYRDYYKTAVYYGSGVPSSSETKREMTGHGNKGWLEFGNHLYRGNVFIPVTSRMAGSTQYNQERVPKSSYMYASQRDLERERVIGARQAIANGQRRTNFDN